MTRAPSAITSRSAGDALPVRGESNPKPIAVREVGIGAT